MQRETNNAEKCSQSKNEKKKNRRVIFVIYSVPFIYRLTAKIENFIYIYRNEREQQAVGCQCRSIALIGQHVSSRGDGRTAWVSVQGEKTAAETVALAHNTVLQLKCKGKTSRSCKSGRRLGYVDRHTHTHTYGRPSCNVSCATAGAGVMSLYTAAT